ncbi:hypothetical protein IAT38_001721 [Cryptococcus sp. DSM 104549]
MASPAPPTPLQNVYYERKTGTPRPCYVCNRPTQTVLATIKTEDFLYTCDGHLSDPASPIAAPAPPPGPSAEDIRKVVADYNAREARKKKGAEKKDDKDKDKDKDGKDGKKDSAKSPSPAPASVPVATTPPAPTHRKFALHRQMFEMRKNELKRKDMQSKAREVGRGLPQVPRTAF